jgi:hypothetical protein
MEDWMELTLGHFGDLRLQKGGPFFWACLLGLVGARFGCVVLAAIVRARSGSVDFYAMPR